MTNEGMSGLNRMYEKSVYVCGRQLYDKSVYVCGQQDVR